MNLPQHVSESVKKRNPNLYPRLGAVPTPVGKHSEEKIVGQESRRKRQGKGNLAVVVTLVRCGARLLDDDNCTAGFKPLRDAIAETLGIDDGDPRIQFRYGQCQTFGEKGTIVKIETV